jgi:hypothetical protein
MAGEQPLDPAVGKRRGRDERVDAIGQVARRIRH